MIQEKAITEDIFDSPKKWVEISTEELLKAYAKYYQ